MNSLSSIGNRKIHNERLRTPETSLTAPTTDGLKTDITNMTDIRVDRVDQEKRQTRAGVAIVLALLVSLAALAIVSKKQVEPRFWITAVAFLAPMPIALLFRKKIASVALWLYIAAVLLLLVSAVLFGV